MDLATLNSKVEELESELIEQRRAEAIIRSESAFHKAIEDSTLAGVAVVDLSGCQTHANRAFCEMVGWSREELVGRYPPFLYWPPEAHNEIIEHFRRIMGGEDPGAGFELPFRRKNEERFHGLVMVSPLIDEQGEKAGFLASIYDITQRKRAEALQSGQAHVLELLATGESLQTILLALTRIVEQQMPDSLASILLMDESGQHLHHGAAAKLPAGYCQLIDGVAIGPTVGSCGTAAYRRERIVVDDIATDPLWADYLDLAKEYGLRACTSQPFFSSSGQILGTVAVYNGRPPYRPTAHEFQFIEMTSRLAGIAVERRKDEQALRHAKDAAEAANKAKDHFLAILSHELRTPLTPVVAVLSSMQRENLPEEIKEDLAMIRRCVELETRLIDDLLDLTRVSRGKLELVVNTIDAHAKLRNVIELCRSEAQSGNLHLNVELDAQQHHLRGDSARLQQVFWNILRNSIKFTPKGGSITARTWNTENGRLAVAISDTGIGIAPEVVPHIFEPFEQGEKNVTRQFGGLGLGLAIAKAVIDLHGGQLRAESKGEGRGATFTVTLDTVAAAEFHDQILTPMPDSPAINRPIRVLLVEDHIATAKVMSRLLRLTGYIVDVADSVATALLAADAVHFDVLISDIGLPDGSGLDLMRQLRSKRDIPGIVLSGFGMQEDVAKSKSAGFSEHLIKPVEISQLETAIRRLVLTENEVPEFSQDQPTPIIPSFANEWPMDTSAPAS